MADGLPSSLRNQHPAKFLTASFLPILALWSFAIAQPLYDLLAQNPTYLVAHRLQGLPLILFVVVISVLLPALIAACLNVLARLHKSGANSALFRAFFGATIYLLLLALNIELLRGVFPELSATYELVVGLAVSAGLFWLIMRQPFVSSFLRLAAVSALIFPIAFLLRLPDGYISIDDGVDINSAEGAQATGLFDLSQPNVELPNIVLVVFDELALTTLLDQELELDRARYPNFHRLASGSTWYSQASAVAAGTRLAVPAILTGVKPVAGRSPDAASHPDNLFSMLAGRYAVNVEEPITKLCDFPKCARPADWALIFSDTLIVLGHIAGPKFVVSRLPAIGGHWIGFASGGLLRTQDKREERIDRFIENLVQANEPGLHVLHSVLPHVPYTLLPSGARLFRHTPSDDQEPTGHVIDERGDRFTDQPWATTVARQLYDWQLRFVDRSLGRILDGLREAGKYDSSLVIVTADHGLRFASGMPRREPKENSFVDIAAIPLFVKWPGQTVGLQDDSPLQSTDIVELTRRAIAGQVAPGDWRSEEEHGAASESPLRTILSTEVEIELPERFDFSSRQNRPLVAIEEQGTLMFDDSVKPVARSDCSAMGLNTEARVTLVQPQLYQHVHPEHFLAAHVLFRSPIPLDADKLIVAFRDRPFAVFQTGFTEYSAFVDPELFRPGFNPLELIYLGESAPCTIYKLPPI